MKSHQRWLVVSPDGTMRLKARRGSVSPSEILIKLTVNIPDPPLVSASVVIDLPEPPTVPSPDIEIGEWGADEGDE